MVPSITRRQFLKASAAGSLYFGDLHNHSEVGYARGSLERAFGIAREHLDFFAFTPHGYWHDIGTYENNIEKKWLDGFEVTKKRWPEVLRAVRKYDEPGRFAPMAGFEWHSTSLGDYHIIFPTLEAEYIRFDSLQQFQRFAKQRGAIMIPHHPANRLGHRGANLAKRNPEVSPVIEMFSEPSTTARSLHISATPKAGAGPKTRCIIFLHRDIGSASSPARTTISASPAPIAKDWRRCSRRN